MLDFYDMNLRISKMAQTLFIIFSFMKLSVLLKEQVWKKDLGLRLEYISNTAKTKEFRSYWHSAIPSMLHNLFLSSLNYGLG